MIELSRRKVLIDEFSRELTDVWEKDELIAGRTGREMSGVTVSYCKMGEWG